jgi:hypothetical protein
MSMFGFQTPEEMLLFIHRRMMEAQAEDQREPVAVDFGDHYVRVVDFFPEVIVVFGSVETIEQVRGRLADQGLMRDEVEFEVQVTLQQHGKGFRFGRAFSELCPEGEFASTHVNQILMTITEDEFEAARRSDWQLLPLMLEGHEFASRVMQAAGLEE